MTTTVDPNYWSLLGVSPQCDPSELKAAFRKEARKWHPDLNKNNINAEERFKLINEAYECVGKALLRLDNKIEDVVVVVVVVVAPVEANIVAKKNPRFVSRR